MQASGVVVRKRDGTQEPFDGGKLRRSLAAAIRECDLDVRLADPLVRAVAMHLRDSGRSRPPTTDYIFRCVRAVLDETGLGEVARQIEAHRRERSARRRSLCVVESCAARGRGSPWRKERVVAELRGRYQIGETTARILAGEIEQRVLMLDYRAVSASLVAELIRTELRAWGLYETMTSDDRPAEAAASSPPAPS